MCAVAVIVVIGASNEPNHQSLLGCLFPVCIMCIIEPTICCSKLVYQQCIWNRYSDLLHHFHVTGEQPMVLLQQLVLSLLHYIELFRFVTQWFGKLHSFFKCLVRVLMITKSTIPFCRAARKSGWERNLSSSALVHWPRTTLYSPTQKSEYACILAWWCLIFNFHSSILLNHCVRQILRHGWIHEM